MQVGGDFMPSNNETTTKFKVDISELKKGIQEATRQIRLANAEFKAASSGMDNWQKSTDGVSKKIASLEKVLTNQNKILDNYKQQLKLIISEQGENSKAADEMRIKIANQEAAINKTAKEINGYKTALNELETEQKEAANSTKEQTSAYDSLQTEISEQEAALEALKQEYANVVLAQGKNSDAAESLANDISDLSGKLADNKKKLSEADSAADEFDKSLENVGDEANNTTSGGLNAFTVALGNLAANIISSAISKMKELVVGTVEVGKAFDSSMSQVSAVSGATGDELIALRDKAKEMGSTTKFTASEAANAFNYMAMAGWKTEDMLNGIDGVLNLAAASGADLATTSDIVTDALTAMGYQAGDAGRLADVMAAASSNANTNVEMMGATFKYAAPVIGAMGYSMEDAAVAIGLMANAGIKGETAGTTLRSVLSRLAAPTKEVQTAMDELGISITKSDGTMKPLNQVIVEMQQAFDGLSESQQTQYAKNIAGTEAMSGLLAIVNAAPSDFDKLTDAVNNSSGAAEQMAATMLDNLGGDMTLLQSKLEGVQLAIYEKFEPALRSGIEVLSGLLDVIQFVVDHSTEFIAALAAMAAGIAAYVAYTTALKVMEEGWMALTIVQKGAAAAQAVLNAVMAANPIGLVVAAIAALVAAFVVLWNKSDAFRQFWINLWNGIKNVVSTVVDWIKENWQTMLLFLINPLAGVFKYCYDHFEGFRDFVDGVIEDIKSFFANAWTGLKSIFSGIATWVNANVFQPIVKFFQPVIDFFKTAWNVIKQLAQGAWIAIKAIWSVVAKWYNDKIITPIRTYFNQMWTTLKTYATNAWNGIKAVWSAVAGWFNTKIISPVSNYFSNMWNKLKSGASAAWSGIKSVFGGVADWFKDKFSKAWQNVKNVFSTGGKIFDGIKEGITNAFKSVVNAIIRGINKVIAIPFNAINNTLDKIRGVSIAGIKPFSGLISRFNVPQIPTLQTGGVLKKGQMGLLEGNGAEAVVPLDRNKKWIAATAKDLKAALKNEGILGAQDIEKTVNNNYNFVQNNTSPKALSRLEIYRQTRNQLAFAKGV